MAQRHDAPEAGCKYPGGGMRSGSGSKPHLQKFSAVPAAHSGFGFGNDSEGKDSPIPKARTHLSLASKDAVYLYVGDAVDLPFKTGSLDAVVGFGFLHHVPDWRQGLSEIARVLKPAGVYYIEELYPSLYQNVITKRILLHPEQDRFTSNDFRKALDEAHLHLADAFELKKMGILGVATKDSL
ncbi:MAG: class I SAM-dependent methyltransferase [Deltaproteobacteria bacterium]|nr:class I SAM-dependent methyltransferase [Deltaproteobacteria bacterium]